MVLTQWQTYYMRAITLYFLLVFLIITRTYASSVLMNSQSSQAEANYCEVLATFEKVTYKNVNVERKKFKKTENITKVYWQFKIISPQQMGTSNCPSGNTYELFLPMVEHVVLPDGTTTDVYPEYIPKPTTQINYLLKLKKVHIKETHIKSERDDFILINWRDGIEAK